MLYPTPTLEVGFDTDPSAGYAELTASFQNQAIAAGAQAAPLVYYRMDGNSTTQASTGFTTTNTLNRWNTSGASGLGWVPTNNITGALDPADPDTAWSSTGGTGGGGYGWLATSMFALTSGSYTLECWFKRASSGRVDPLFYFGPSTLSGPVIYLKVRADDKIALVTNVSLSVDVTTAVASSVTVTDTNWHHVVFVSAGGRLFLDGVLVGASGTDSPGIATTSNFFSVVMAPAQVSPTVAFNGSVDEVAVYSVSLTDAQVAQHYASATVQLTTTWTDVSAYFIGGTTSRGRQHELDTIQAGTGTIRLRNTDRRFDPLNTAGPYYGKLLPLRRLRLKWTINAVTYTRFLGFIERWPQTREGPSWAYVDLTVVDGFEQLAQTDISTGFPSNGFTGYVNGSSGAYINGVLDVALWPRALRNIDGGYVQSRTALAAFTPGTFQGALPYIQSIADGELGYFFISADGLATFHDRYHRVVNTAGNTSQATFGDAASGAALTYTNIVFDYSKDWIQNDVTSTAQMDSSWGTTTQQNAQDGASIVHYFRRSQQRSPMVEGKSGTGAPTGTTADTEALLQSTIIVKEHAAPQLRVETIDLVPTTTAMWAQILTREIGDRVTVQANPVGGGAQISLDCYIEAIQDDFPQQGTWKSTWQLTPVSAGPQGWILDDPVWSILDSTTVLAT